MITAYVNATVLNGYEDMEPQAGMTIIVDGETIAAVGPAAETPVPNGARVVDVAGAYVAPGMVNMHVHLCGSGKAYSAGGAGKIIDFVVGNPIGMWYLRHTMKQQLNDQLMSGVTTVRSVGDPGYADVQVRDLIRAGKFFGPRLLTSGTGVTVTGGHGAGLFAKIGDTPEAAREIVREAAAHNVDLIKLFITGGVMDSTVEGEAGLLRMPLDVAAAAVDEAHKLGLSTAAHIESSEGVLVGLQAGVDTIEHGGPLTEETIALFKENGVGRSSSVTSTFSPALPYAVLPTEKTRSTHIVQVNSMVVFNGIVECAKQAIDAGIPVGLGTDSACPYVTHYDMWREVMYFHRLVKVSRAFALHTATLGNARLLGLGDVTGSIEAGKCADMIVLDRNPLEDLAALRDVKMVVARGTLVEHPKHRAMPDVDEGLEDVERYVRANYDSANAE